MQPGVGSIPLQESAPGSCNELPQQEGVFIGGETVELLKEMVELREKDVVKRIHIQNGLRDMKYKWQHAKRAQHDFMQASTAYMSTISNQAQDNDAQRGLRKAWHQLESMADVVKTRETWLETSQNNLMTLENKLFMKEDQFYGKFRWLSGDMDFSDDEITDNIVTVSASSSSSATTDPVARKYYDQVGQLHLLRERIFNLDSGHQRQKRNRDQRRRESRSLEILDKEFFQSYFTEKEKMIREYMLAKHEMEQLKEACNQGGVSVQSPSLPPFLDHLNRLGGHPHTGQLEDGLLKRHDSIDRESRTSQWVRQMQRTASSEILDYSLYDLKRVPIDLPSPLYASDLQEWTDQEAEDYLALPSYNQLQPPSLSEQSTTETNRPQKIAKEEPAMTSRGAESFRGDPPQRRYSAPSLPAHYRPPAFLSKTSLGSTKNIRATAPPISQGTADGIDNLNVCVANSQC